MSCSNSCAHNADSSISVGSVETGPRTVRSTLDNQIDHARLRVEKLCILKAKLETLGVLDHPVELYEQITFG